MSLAASMPPEMAALRPWMLRAGEMQGRDPVVAYFCASGSCAAEFVDR